MQDWAPEGKARLAPAKTGWEVTSEAAGLESCPAVQGHSAPCCCKGPGVQRAAQATPAPQPGRPGRCSLSRPLPQFSHLGVSSPRLGGRRSKRLPRVYLQVDITSSQ